MMKKEKYEQKTITVPVNENNIVVPQIVGIITDITYDNDTKKAMIICDGKTKMLLKFWGKDKPKEVTIHYIIPF